jgi:hypothetical protein
MLTAWCCLRTDRQEPGPATPSPTQTPALKTRSIPIRGIP